jgi:hypothetical protein
MVFLVRPSVFVFISPQFTFLFVRWLQAQRGALDEKLFKDRNPVVRDDDVLPSAPVSE